MEEAVSLQEMKHESIHLAKHWAIPVNNEVFLVPIGSWILSQSQYVKEMAMWRFESRNSFFARFPLSVESFSSYLMTHAIEDQCNVTFAVMQNHSELLGHAGLSSVNGHQATIDAVMIRPENRSSGLAQISLQTLVSWAQKALSVKRFQLEVLSSNESAIKLYSRLGFEISSRRNLREVVNGELKILEECTLEKSDVEELKLIMTLMLADSPVA